MTDEPEVLLEWTERISRYTTRRQRLIEYEDGEKKVAYHDDEKDQWYLYPIEVEVDNLP